MSCRNPYFKFEFPISISIEIQVNKYQNKRIILVMHDKFVIPYIIEDVRHLCNERTTSSFDNLQASSYIARLVLMENALHRSATGILS